MPGVRCVVEKLNISIRHEIAVGLNALRCRLPTEFFSARDQELDVYIATVGLQSRGISCFSEALHVHGLNSAAFDGNALIYDWSGGLMFQEIKGLCKVGVDAAIFFTVF